jgi:FkbM family methyltransferase
MTPFPLVLVLLLFSSHYSLSASFDPATYYVEQATLYENKDDHDFIKKTMRDLGDAMKNTTPPVLVNVGMNKGSLMRLFFQSSPLSEIHGFDIQEQMVQKASSMHKQHHPNSFKKSHFHRLGMSNITGVMNVAGFDEIAGLYSQERMDAQWKKTVGRQWPKTQSKPVEVTTLSKWRTANSVSRVEYCAIDVEGHEVKVILGRWAPIYTCYTLIYTHIYYIRVYTYIHLYTLIYTYIYVGMELEMNQQKFPAFQFEIGSIWDGTDARRASNEWTIQQMFSYLTNLGYTVFIIGRGPTLQIDDFSFFDRVCLLTVCAWFVFVASG